MKRILTTIPALILTICVFAQTPQKMSYQAVIRDASNNLVKSLPIGIRISILRITVNGAGVDYTETVYTETQTKTTNENGLVTLEIGGAAPVFGTYPFEGINWSTGPYFIKTEIDPTGGTNYTITGTSQLLSVPYALYSKTSEKANELELKLLKLSNSVIAGGMVSDIDGNAYNIIKIGTQVWMSENLKTTRYRNGDLIGTTTPATLDLSGESTPKYQWAYGGDESKVPTYGRLYTWYAITDSRNVCPIGWHVPTDAEWTTLTDYLISNGYGYEGSGDDIGKSMAATFFWTISYWIAGSVGNDQASNNSSGFSALPGGYRFGEFHYIGFSGFWWSATESVEWPYGIWGRDLNANIFTLARQMWNKKLGLSVRCVKDN